MLTCSINIKSHDIVMFILKEKQFATQHVDITNSHVGIICFTRCRHNNIQTFGTVDDTIDVDSFC